MSTPATSVPATPAPLPSHRAGPAGTGTGVAGVGGGLFTLDVSALTRAAAASSRASPSPIRRAPVVKTVPAPVPAAVAGPAAKEEEDQGVVGGVFKKGDRIRRTPPPPATISTFTPIQGSWVGLRSASRDVDNLGRTPSRKPRLQQPQPHKQKPSSGITTTATTLRKFGLTRSTNLPAATPSPPVSREATGQRNPGDVLKETGRADGGGNENQEEEEEEVEEEVEEEGDMLIAALMQRKRMLEGEVKRKRGELEEEEERGREMDKQRERASLKRRKTGVGENEEGGLEELIKSLLAANDSILTTKPPLPSHKTPQHISSAPGTEKQEDTIPSVRPLPLPSNPNHPQWRTWCPFTFTSHTTTLVSPPPSFSSSAATPTPPSFTTAHTLRGHSPDKLFFFSFNYSVQHTPVTASSTSTQPSHTSKRDQYEVESKIISLPSPKISSWARPELDHVLRVASKRRDLLLAMASLNNYYAVAVKRAECWGELVEGGLSGSGLGKGEDKHGVAIAEGVHRRSKGPKREKKRRKLLRWLGEQTLLIHSSGPARGPESEVLISWHIPIDPITGEAKSDLSAEVAIPNPTTLSKRGKGKVPRGAAGRAVEGAVTGREISRLFEELAREGGVVRGVKGVVGVVFGEADMRAPGRRKERHGEEERDDEEDGIE